MDKFKTLEDFFVQSPESKDDYLAELKSQRIKSVHELALLLGDGDESTFMNRMRQQGLESPLVSQEIYFAVQNAF